MAPLVTAAQAHHSEMAPDIKSTARKLARGRG